jgi:zinc D-Ala-D-Ala dipeptidase
MALVPITPPAFDLEIAMAYATADNFTGRPVYRRAAAYLRPEAAEKLRRAIELAALIGLRFRLFDAFRPSEAQWKLWEHSPDPDFLADPRRGSPHSRGVAVDLTLLDEAGHALDMGTPFDEFSPRAHHGSPLVGEAATRNRLLLLGLMTNAGWDFYSKEWWHYQLFDSRKFELLSDSALEEPMMPPQARP